MLDSTQPTASTVGPFSLTAVEQHPKGPPRALANLSNHCCSRAAAVALAAAAIIPSPHSPPAPW